ncbi:peroxidasin-like isoform X2 [Lineus longissimus]|uniref:peroxidasin-like isoform X2 n=1 Tax=Lineus longissimus TaxID=88925 RepID=UPI00315CFBE3
MTSIEQDFSVVSFPPLTPTVTNPSPVKVGKTAKFTCNAENGSVTKPVTYTWTKNGDTVSPGTIEPGALLFSPAKKSDAGKYVCVAKNVAGSMTSIEQDFVVYFPPLTPTVTNPSPVKVGKTAKFTCNAENENVTKPVTYTWTKNGDTVSPGTTEPGALLFSPVKKSDAGKYVCVAKNDAGSMTSIEQDFRVVSFPPLTPTVTNPSPVKVGKTAKFTCNAENENVTKPVTYTWTKNGDTVSPGTTEPGALLFSPVKKSDAGKYVCVAKNDAGSMTSIEQDFRVVSFPPLTPTVTNPSPVKVGKTAKFTCNAENGSVTKPVTYTWTKNGDTVSPGTIEPGALLFSPAKKSDAGKYVCVAKNVAGSMTSIEQDFVVYFPPLTPTVTNPSPVKVGKTAKFTCNAENENVTKPVTYTWTKNGDTVSPGTTEPGALLFSPVKKSDAGKYVCVAKNDAGSMTSIEQDFRVVSCVIDDGLLVGVGVGAAVIVAIASVGSVIVLRKHALVRRRKRQSRQPEKDTADYDDTRVELTTLEKMSVYDDIGSD